MDNHYEIMTEHFAENFVNHCHIGLAPQAIAELSLHHRERGLDVRPLVVVLQKLFPLELKVVKCFVPNAAPIVAPGIRFESNEWFGSDGLNSLKVCTGGIPFVGADFGDLKVLRSRVHKSGEQRGIACISAMNFDGGNNIGFHAAHNVAFDPIMLLLDDSVLVVKPTGEMASSEPGRVHSKIRFNRCERQTALSDKRLQHRRQFRVFKVIGNGVEVRNLRNVSAPMRFAKIAHKSPLGYRRVDFERGSEQRVGQGQTWSASPARGRNHARAQISQEQLKFILLMGLRLIVSGPILRISLLRLRDRKTFSNRHSAVSVPFAFHYKRCGVDVLTLDPTSLMVGAGASSNLSPNNDLVFGSVARLRRDEPNPVLLMNLSGCCQFQTALFSKFHDNLASLENILLSRCRVVKNYFQKSFQPFQKLLDTVSVSGILLASWHWSPLSSKATNALAVSTNGFLARVRKGSLESALSASHRIGTNPEKISEKRYNSEVLAESEGIEPPHAVRAARLPIWSRTHYRSGCSPLRPQNFSSKRNVLVS